MSLTDQGMSNGTVALSQSLRAAHFWPRKTYGDFQLLRSRCAWARDRRSLRSCSDSDANARLLSMGLSPKGVMPVLGSPTASEADSRTPRCQYQPVLPRETFNVWARVDTSRRDIDAAFKKTCIELGIAAYVGRSNSFEFPASVLFEAWIPQDSERNLTERVWARVTIEPKPFHPFEIEYHVEIHNRGREKLGPIWRISTGRCRRNRVTPGLQKRKAKTYYPHSRFHIAFLVAG